MKKPYQIEKQNAKAHVAWEQFTKANGQFLLPLVELITEARLAIDEVIDQVGRQTIETILQLSAQEVAGPRTPGKASGAIRWHGSQPGRVMLPDRPLQVRRPRLRHKEAGEVPVPAYEALQDAGGTGQRMLGALLRGVSTREYESVIPEMAATVGVKRSSVSRQVIEASAAQLEQLRERRWDQVDLLVIYIDSQRFGAHHLISAVGVDREGKKHVLGLEAGATENAAAVKRLLVHWREHGLATERRDLFIIDGAKVLRAAIDEVFGQEQPVQRCRNHKLNNVLAEVPKEQHGQVRNLMRAAWKAPTGEEGAKRLEQLARWLESSWEAAARSLREGMAEVFTLQRLQIPPSLHKCLATTNLIESPQGGVRKRTGNVTRWRDADMAQRWAASAWLLTEKRFRKIDGHQHLWALANILGREKRESATPKERVA